MTSRILSRVSLLALSLGMLGVAALPGSSRADDAGLVVLSATSAQYHPGDKVSGTASLSIAAGDSLTLVAADGSVITLKGPYQGLPTSTSQGQSASVSDMLSPLLQKASAENATPGVIRGSGVAGPSTDPWVIDSSKSGDVCIHQAVEYDVWRSDASQPATLTMAPVSGGDPTSFAFAAGQARIGVPDSVSFEDGTQYKITEPNGTTSTITVHTIPQTVPTNNKVTAAWFLKQKCQEQAEALAKWLVN
jgi:hypothetical protein